MVPMVQVMILEMGFSQDLKYITKKIFWPTIYSAYTLSVLRDKGYEVDYKTEISDDYDFYIFTSSVVTHESEIEKIKELNKKTKNNYNRAICIQ